MVLSRRSLRVFSLIWLLIASSITSCRAGEPPLMNSEFESTVRAQLMDDVKITCPVRQADDQSELMFNWMKDNESISAAWTRFRQNGPHLKIQNVEIPDSGTYACRAVNGYGNQEVNIQLIVTDMTDHQLSESTSDSTAAVVDGESEGEDEEDEEEEEEEDGESRFEEFPKIPSRLNFTEDTLRQPTLLRVTTNSSFSIQCGVIGYPYPGLVWLKNDKEHAGSLPTQLDQNGGMISLFIHRATIETTGNYTCIARGLNNHQIQITFNIQVLDPQKMMNDMSQIYPTTNTTELRGGRVKFVCWVTSATRPDTVEWLKILPRHKSTLHPNTSLIIGDDQYQKLVSEEALASKEDGITYMLPLIFNPLHESNAGSYLCLSRNKYGYNLKSTYLSVKLNYETKENKSVPLSIMVALPSALILSIAGGFVCWVREREKQRRREIAAAAAAAAGGGYVGGSRNNHLAVAAAAAAALEASAHRLSISSSNRVPLMSGAGGGGGSVASSRRQSSSGNDDSSLAINKSSAGTATERAAGKQQQHQQQQRGASRSSLDQQSQTPNHYFERRHNHPRVTNTSSSLV